MYYWFNEVKMSLHAHDSGLKYAIHKYRQAAYNGLCRA